MVKVYEMDGVTPVVHPSAYVHPSAVLIGDVIVGPRCYVGPLAVMRGDFGRLILEEGANLQDNCVMHGFPGDDTVVEVDGHIGHGAVLHGCRIKRNAMVGMNAVVMDMAIVGEESIVAAMSFVKTGMLIPPRSMVMGAPARVVRALTDKDVAWKSFGTRQYHELVLRSQQSMRYVDSKDAVEADRQRIAFGAEPHQPKKSNTP
ncbi:MAG: phenylacetic acid degradation protein PaaY [Massilia sp.]|nr:phenylacetic acid degradation protein PaaY [Massilia sp.]